MKKLSIRVFLVSMIIANIVSALVFMNKADAKKAVKGYVKNITVSLKKDQKKKTVNLSAKLKKGDKITTKKTAKNGVTVKRISAKKVQVSVSASAKSTSIKLRTKKNGIVNIKVKIQKASTSKKNTEKKNEVYQSTYSGHTFTFPSASEKSYFDKIITELQSQLADPDKTYKEVYGKTFKSAVPLERKKQNLLQQYLNSHASYSHEDKGSCQTDTTWKQFYEGTFKGVCWDGADVGCRIALALGFNARAIAVMGVNHGWLAIEAVDASGVTYWQGFSVTSYAEILSFDQPMVQLYPDQEYRYDIVGVTSYSQLHQYTPDLNWR